ncbi:MAG: hypothetical protein LBP63_06270 [Prevotellaceae bacterium]|jgi:hypothetical protein|nr:hypothetical protein [Prevotellaceae bacterium]
MKKSGNKDNSTEKTKKNESTKTGDAVTFSDSDTFFSAESKKNFTAAIIGIAKNIDNNIFSQIRNELYSLYINNQNIEILDLGNFAFSSNKIKKLITRIKNSNIHTVFLCEDDEISSTILQFQQDANSGTAMILADITSDNKHISKILSNKSEISVIGYQNYFSDRKLIDKLNKNNCTAIRLSEYRAKPNDIEPVLRESAFMVIDLSAVRYSDGGTAQSPNGLYAEELCSIANCAGLSNKISRINIVCSSPDNTLTNKLVAQTIWHFADGLSYRIIETPTSGKFKKFIVDMGKSTTNLTFYKSNITNRWWMEVSNGERIKITACTFDDYQEACKKNIPARWIKEMQKMG